MKFSFKFVDDKGDPSFSRKEVDDIYLSAEEESEAISYCIDKADIFNKHLCLDGSLCIAWHVEYTLDKALDQNVPSYSVLKV